MSQYRTGTCDVVNADQTVTGVGTLFLANVSAGDVWTKTGSSVPYIVGSVTDDTHLELATPYAGATENGISYSITTSFTPNLNIAYIEQDDLDTATILKRAMLTIDGWFGGGTSGLEFLSPVLTTPQINDTTGDHQYIFAVSELAADRNLTLPLLGADDEFVFKTHAVELSNKTLNAPVLKGTATASGTFTMPAFTLGGAVTGNGQNVSGLGTVGSGAITSTGVLDTFVGANGIYWRGGSGDTARQLTFTTSTGTNPGDTHTLNAQSSTGVINLATFGTTRVAVSSAGAVITGTLSATGNVTFGDAPTDIVTVNGYMGIGSVDSTVGIYVANTALTSASQHGIYSYLLGSSSATTLIAAVVGHPRTAAASFTVANVMGLRANNAVKGAGSTIDNLHGVYIADQIAGTNNNGITSLVSAGANKRNLNITGTADNYLAGALEVGGNLTLSKTITAAGTTGAQTINKTTGSVNFAAAATSLVVTNSLVDANSVIRLTIAANDATMKSVAYVPAAGSFTIYANAAATAETRVDFTVTN